ncbi:MAG: GDP-mannose 4,6-dehydratase [Alphaproteobacteria bacterium]|nr:GDP-mannose 4,6-dehydratase [Alphaproteobacteria bacterium]
MVRFLVTGATGMVGSHLVERLHAAAPGAVLGTSFGPAGPLPPHRLLMPLDVRDAAAVRDCIAEARPAVIYHLAAQSLPTLSWRDPWTTMDTNVQGTVNVFEAVRAVRATADAGYDPMVVVACSSAEYGASLTPERVPIDEEAPLLPLHPYGVSKVAQDLLAFQYWRNERIRTIRARIFNTTGPRKTADVIADFAGRVAAIVRRGGGALRVGNLDARRAILDVRDLLAALTLLAERGEPGEAYNICAEAAHPVGDLVPIFERLAGRALPLETDPALLRPSDEPVILGRTDKLRARTGWRPRVTLEETVRAVLDDAMARIPA